MTKAATAIRKILREHGGDLPLSARHEIGDHVAEHLDSKRGERGSDVMGRLAKEVGVSPDTLRHGLRFRRYWPEGEIKHLDAKGVRWRYVLALIPLAKRVQELRKGADNFTTRGRRAAVGKIERARKRFLKLVITAKVGLREFERRVRQWRLENASLWAEGARGAMVRDARRRAEGAYQRALAALEEMELLGASSGAGRAREALEEALRSIDVI